MIELPVGLERVVVGTMARGDYCYFGVSVYFVHFLSDQLVVSSMLQVSDYRGTMRKDLEESDSLCSFSGLFPWQSFIDCLP